MKWIDREPQNLLETVPFPGFRVQTYLSLPFVRMVCAALEISGFTGEEQGPWAPTDGPPEDGN